LAVVGQKEVDGGVEGRGKEIVRMREKKKFRRAAIFKSIPVQKMGSRKRACSILWRRVIYHAWGEEKMSTERD